MFADGVDGERISHFGDRFAYYAKRVRTLTLDQGYPSEEILDEIFGEDFDEDPPNCNHYVVHPTVLLAWGRHHHLFPRLSELAVCGRPSLDPAQDEQVFRQFIRSPHLISLIVNWGEQLCKLSQESVDALVDVCARLERVQFVQFGHGPSPRNGKHPLPGLLHRITEGAAHLRSVQMNHDRLVKFPVQFATLLNLATMPTLQVAELSTILDVPAVFRLPSSPFSALRSLHIVDNTSHLHLSRNILQSCASPCLAHLQIRIEEHKGSDGTFMRVSKDDLHSLSGLLSHRSSLTSLRLVVQTILDTDSDVCYTLPPLPHLTVLGMSGWCGAVIEIDAVKHILSLYPQLERWDYRNDKYYAAVTLSDLLELLQPRPMIRALPVIVASTEVPSEEALAQLGTITYGDLLYVMDGVDTPELCEVIQRIFPGVTIEVST
jgi:hypothetical protein